MKSLEGLGLKALKGLKLEKGICFEAASPTISKTLTFLNPPPHLSLTSMQARRQALTQPLVQRRCSAGARLELGATNAAGWS